MRSTILNVFYPPHFPDDPDKSRVARYIHVIVLITFMALTALIVGSLFNNTHGNLSVILILDLALAAAGTFSAVQNRRGNVQLAASIMLASYWCVTTLFVFSDLRPEILFTITYDYLFIVVVSGLLMGKRAPFAVAATSSLSLLAWWLYLQGSTNGESSFLPGNLIASTALLFAVAAVINLIASSLRETNSLLHASLSDLKRTVSDLEGAQTLLQQRLERIQFMSQLASDFVTASTSDIDTTIHRALEIVTRFAKVERGYVFLLTEDGQTLILTHEWCMPGVLAHKGVLESLAVADFSEFVDSLKRGEVANVQTAEVPRTPDTKAMTDILDLLEIRSFVNIPMHVTNGFVGFIGFDATYTPTIWSEETIAEFRFTGQMIASTLERRRVEREIRLANSLLEQRVAERTLALEVANKELEAFSYSVSHDLRTPLRAIDGYSQALLEDCSNQLDSTGKNYLQRTRAATQRMGSLIDDMLKLARVTRNPLKKELVDLSSMVQTIAADLQEQQPARKAHWKIEPNLIAQADPALLKMALDNLIGNAWKFTSKIEETCIEFGQTPMHGDKTYYVRDNGAGFDMAYADQLFQPFYRLHGQTEFEGSGIGLATVQRVMTRHGGRVWVEAAVHKGATFYFTL